jgi:hypothetical protein
VVMSPLRAAALALAIGGAVHGPLPPAPSRKAKAAKPKVSKAAMKRRAKQKAQRKARMISRGKRPSQARDNGATDD